MKWLTHMNNHMIYNFNLSNIIKMTYNSISKCLYLYTINGEQIEIENVSKGEYIDIVKEVHNN